MRYLCATVNYGLMYVANKDVQLYGSTDSN